MTYVISGMFLFAHLVAENLLRQATLEDLDSELDPKTFPCGTERLDKAYVSQTNNFHTIFFLKRFRLTSLGTRES